MEADTGLAVTFFQNSQHTAVAGWFPYGRVMYEHGGGIDAPLGVVRMEFSDVLHDPQGVFPFHTWRGTAQGQWRERQAARMEADTGLAVPFFLLHHTIRPTFVARSANRVAGSPEPWFVKC